MNALGDLWNTLKPAIIPIPVSPETERVLRRVFFMGAVSALSLHGHVQAEEQRVIKRSLEELEAEISRELDLPAEPTGGA